ncbi:Gfo/Idh/MocA family protein [Amycolatopsis sp. cg5]|uniref:Gfo/Idh/MocA family protein n=1 Tax=Amycolatopsis sp. cg5 TaxID=3238802 RepID=UPI0035242949
MSQVRFGVLGCADIAWRRMLPAMAADAGVTIAAVASRTPEKADRFARRFGCAAVTGYQELLDRADIDAVYIPLPAVLHAEWTERALLAGKHVLAEKPLTTDLPIAAKLADLAKSTGRLLFENFMFLHHSQHRAVRELIDGGAIGEPRGFSATFTIPPKPPGDIRYQSGVGGGGLLDVGGYPLRAALHFLGPDLEFAGGVLRHDRGLDLPLSGTALLATPAGVTANLTFGMEHSYVTSYEFAGSTGRLFLDRVFTPPVTHQPVVRIERQDHREELTLPPDDQFANVVALFARAVLDGTDLDGHLDGSLRQAALMDQVRDGSRRIMT